jgi:hypothetical protein
VYIGIDPSLRNVGLVALGITKKGVPSVIAHTTITTAKQSHAQAAVTIADGVWDWVRHARVGHEIDGWFVEGFSRGSRFRREEAGVAWGAVMIGLSKARYHEDVIAMTPRAGKVMAVPDWPGLSKAKWVAAGRDPKKYKSSQPCKASVKSGLWRLYGLRFDTEHEVDAACIVLAGCKAQGVKVKECGYG